MVERFSLIVRHTPGRTRRGISALEFLGAFAALVGGLVIGTLYLGVDVKGLAGRVLQLSLQQSTAAATQSTESEVERNASPPAASPETPAAAASADEPQNVQAPTTTPTPLNPLSILTQQIELTDDQRQAATKAYWEALNGAMQAELGNRAANLKPGDDSALYNYLEARTAAHRRAADDIAKLDAAGVDSHVLAYGKKALTWHEEGANLYARAKDLLTDAPTAQLSGPFAQSWQSAATQHQMEERLLAEKRAAVESYLAHQRGPDSTQ
jgi:hypothetical protein